MKLFNLNFILAMAVGLQCVVGTPNAYAQAQTQPQNQAEAYECKDVKDMNFQTVSPAEAQQYYRVEEATFGQLPMEMQMAKMNCLAKQLQQVQDLLDAQIAAHQASVAKNNVDSGKLVLGTAIVAVASSWAFYKLMYKNAALTAQAKLAGDEALAARASSANFEPLIVMVLALPVGFGLIVQSMNPAVTFEQAVDLKKQFNYMQRILEIERRVHYRELKLKNEGIQ